jgi:hypothetical protein
MALIDYLVVAAYFFAVLYVRLRARRSVRTSDDFFLSGRSLPLWITDLSFMAANLGSLADGFRGECGQVWSIHSPALLARFRPRDDLFRAGHGSHVLYLKGAQRAGVFSGCTSTKNAAL